MKPAAARTPALVLVVAVAENGVIGRGGTLPWRLKSDMAHFVALTKGKPVVMGRKTWASLQKQPLPGRTNIVVTRDAGFTAPGALVAGTIDRALDAARGDALRRGTDSIAIIGGAEIFNATLPLADRVAFTRVHLKPEGDAHFPPLPLSDWREVAKREQPAGPDDEAAFTILTYQRIRTS